MNLTINIDGIADKLQQVNDAVHRGHVQLTSSVGLRFAGEVLPRLQRGVDYVDLTWVDKVEIDLPGFVDPDVSYVRVWRDRAEVRLRVGGVVTVKPTIATTSKDDPLEALRGRLTAYVEGPRPAQLRLKGKRLSLRDCRKDLTRKAAEELGVSTAFPTWIIWLLLNSAVRSLVTELARRLYERLTQDAG